MESQKTRNAEKLYIALPISKLNDASTVQVLRRNHVPESGLQDSLRSLLAASSSAYHR